MLKQIVASRWFRLADLFLVISSGLLWTLGPEIGILPVITLALLPSIIRIIVGLAPLRKTPFDWLVAVFLLTAWVGYWVAYDREAAWAKVWFIVLSVLLYYSLATQPEENLDWVCTLLFCIGFGVAIYFFLTHDFLAFPRRLEVANRAGRWLMERIPRLEWTPIHPNYAAGTIAITTPFILYPARKLAKVRTSLSIIAWWLIVMGCSTALLAVVMATSRGVVLAVASALGVWFLWRLVVLIGSKSRFRREVTFPSLILVFLCAVVLFLYLGPANAGDAVSDNYYYGTGSRSELASRSLYIVSAFPFTGGGLTSFPGLYSYYILGIPNMNVPNSHNLFLDIAIEQGLLGGLSIFAIFVASILYTTRLILNADSPKARIFSWLTLFALVIAFTHGMVDDYLYNVHGTMLLLSLFGLPMMIQADIGHYLNYRIPGYAALIVISFLLINLNKVQSAWFANFGAVHMEKVELAGFPTNRWTDSSILSELDPANVAFHSALQIDPTNRTANYRLGLIALLQQDFDSAAAYLERAKQEAPNHRGIIKSLGYCYVWLGDMEKAELFLSQIPEAQDELRIYSWWWEAQGRPDLTEKASAFFSVLEKQFP